MPRTLRVEYAGAICHVLNRGDRRESICKEDQERAALLARLGEALAKTAWQVPARCLMPHPFHLVMETTPPDFAAGRPWFPGTCTARFKRRHKVFGHLFRGRYKSLIVHGSGTEYLRTVCDYLHLNPARVVYEE